MFKRAVFAEEPSRGMTLDDGRLKSLTGGASNKDRRLHENTKVKWKPQCTLVIATNEKLRINDTSEGMWDRVRFIPFEARIKKEAIRPDIWDHFHNTEASGILSLMVESASVLIHSGEPEPPLPKKIVDAVEEYRGEQDILGQFLEERVRAVEDPNCYITKTAMFEAYQEWCRSSGHYPLNKNNFGKRLSEDKGWDKKQRRENKRVWIKIELSQNESSAWPTLSAVS
jgi:putative DNA primase/helicase